MPKEVAEQESARAVVRDGVLEIRIAVAMLPVALRGAYDAGGMDQRFKVTDADKFAHEVARALNDEEEDGTTPIHSMFDAAFQSAIENGAEGVEEDPESDDE